MVGAARTRPEPPGQPALRRRCRCYVDPDAPARGHRPALEAACVERPAGSGRRLLMTEALRAARDRLAGRAVRAGDGLRRGHRGRHEARRPGRDRAVLGRAWRRRPRPRRGDYRVVTWQRPRPRRAPRRLLRAQRGRSSTRRRSASMETRAARSGTRRRVSSGRPATRAPAATSCVRRRGLPRRPRWSAITEVSDQRPRTVARLPERHAGRPATTAATSWAWPSSWPTTARSAPLFPELPAAAHRQRRRERADERRQRRAGLPRGRALRRDAEGHLRTASPGSPASVPGRPYAARCRSAARRRRPGAMAAWHATYHAAHVFGQEYPSPVDARGDARRVPRRAGRRADRALRRVRRRGLRRAPGSSSCRRWTTCTSRVVEVVTHPDHRGRGHGTAMLDAPHRGRAVRRAATPSTPTRSGPTTRPADGRARPEADFLTRHGFRFSLGDVKRVLDLPVDDAAAAPAGRRRRAVPRGLPLRRLRRAGARGHHRRLRRPRRLADLRGADGRPGLRAGGVRRDPDPRRREGASRRPAARSTPPSRSPRTARWWPTPSWRCRRTTRAGPTSGAPSCVPSTAATGSGMATKVHNLRRFQAAEPAGSLLFTYNAEVNAHMIGVNDAMGFRPVQRLGEFQKKLLSRGSRSGLEAVRASRSEGRGPRLALGHHPWGGSRERR